MRRSPFGEWNIVYFDPGKTDSDKILKRLRANKCPNAELIARPASTHRVLTPIVTPGDGFQVVSTSAEAPSVTLPAGWSASRQERIGDGRWLTTVQTPRKSKAKKYTVTLDGAKAQVELVSRVR